MVIGELQTPKEHSGNKINEPVKSVVNINRRNTIEIPALSKITLRLYRFH
jgi:hypothetical protein